MSDLDYTSSDIREFDLDISYESFLVHNVTNFALSETDLSRFEDASGFTGPAFEEINKPIILGSQSYLDVLGDDDKGTAIHRPRSFQGSVETQFEARDNLDPDVQPTYKGEGTYAGGAGAGNDGTLIDELFGIADDIITTGINGGDLKDAAIGTVAGSVIKYIKKSPLSTAINNIPNPFNGDT
jgi:hypothetical protein